VPIGEEKIGDFLDRLAGRMPAPGGGAAAAFQVAMAAALLGMAARYANGGGDAGHEEAIGGIVTKLDELRAIALRLAEADTEAFAAAAGAYRLPESTAEDQAARAAAITGALINLTWPSAKVISLAGMVVDIGGALAAASGRSPMSEVAAAAEAARAAVAIARVNIEINLAGITDEQASLEMIAETGNAGHIIDRAGQLSDAVREQIRA
jgi:formiminotetrahydrofolate cyclodeaminase